MKWPKKLTGVLLLSGSIAITGTVVYLSADDLKDEKEAEPAVEKEIVLKETYQEKDASRLIAISHSSKDGDSAGEAGGPDKTKEQVEADVKKAKIQTTKKKKLEGSKEEEVQDLQKYHMEIKHFQHAANSQLSSVALRFEEEAKQAKKPESLDRKYLSLFNSYKEQIQIKYINLETMINESDIKPEDKLKLTSLLKNEFENSINSNLSDLVQTFNKG